MPGSHLSAVKAKRSAWNKGCLIGQKRPLLPKQVWAIRARLELAGNFRDLALFNLAVDSKLLGCDLVRLRVSDRVAEDRVRDRVTIVQSETRRPVQFEVSENTLETILNWLDKPEMRGHRYLFSSRLHASPHLSARQCAAGSRLGNLRAVQLPLGHTKVDSTVRYLGVELEDALSIAERIDI